MSNVEKIFISGREGRKICLLLKQAQNAKGLAFVCHGLGGFKEQPQILSFVNAIFADGYTVISYDARNTFGESEGEYKEATVTSYYNDLEDVIHWAKDSAFYQEPFILCGTSLGGLITALFAQKHSEMVKSLLSLSTVVSGKFYCSTYSPDLLSDWEEGGIWNFGESPSKKGVMKELKWQFIEDISRYDLLPDAHTLTMPVLVIVGEDDSTTPLKYQEIFFKNIPNEKKLQIIKGGKHTFHEKEELDLVEEIITDWLKAVD